MTIFRRFSLGVAILLMLAIAVGLMSFYFYVRSVDQTFLPNTARRVAENWSDWIHNSPVFGAVLLLVVVILVSCSISMTGILLGIGPPRKRYLTMQDEGGRTSVALRAIENLLQRRGSAVSGIKDLRVNAEVPDTGGLLGYRRAESASSLVVHVRAIPVLSPVRDIPAVKQELKKVISSIITDTLGCENIKELNVIIEEIVTDESAPSPAPEPAVLPRTSTDEPPDVEERAAEPESGDEPVYVKADEDTRFWREKSDDGSDDEKG